MSEKPAERKPDPAPPPAAPPSVGSVLRQRRQMRGQSLESVHQATRIPRGLLQALEEDRHAEFPAPVYMRGFLKTYCDLLELEFDPLWQRVAPAQDAASEAPADRHEGRPRPLARLSAPAVAPFLVVGGLVATGIGVWTVTRLLGSPRRAPARTPAAAAAAIPALTPPATAEAAVLPPPSPAPAAPAPAAPAPEPAAPAPSVRRPGEKAHVFQVTGVSSAWISVSRDGMPEFEGRLPAGKQFYLDHGEVFTLHAPDPKGVRVELRGRPVDLSALKPERDGGYRLGRK